MNISSIVRSSGAAAAITTLFVAGTAFAQTTTTVNPVTVSTSPVTTSVTPGTGVNLGTITLSGSPTGATITSIPLTVTPAGGGTVSNLSNCQIFNSAGLSVTSGSPVVIGSGSNTFTLNAPLTVNNTPTTLNIRCDVGSTTASGASFQFLAGSPVVTPALNENLDTAPSVPAGSTNVALANLSLGGLNSGANVNISSLPLTISSGSGASISNLTNCMIRGTANTDTTMTGAVNLSASGSPTTFVFASPLTVFSGTAPMLAFACDVQPGTPVGGSFTISADPNGVVATNAATGARVSATPVVGVGPNGLPASLSGTVLVTGSTGTGTGTATGSTGTGTGTSGTGTRTATGSTSGHPGVPNTGVGDIGYTFGVLLLAGFLALVSGFYLRRSLMS